MKWKRERDFLRKQERGLCCWSVQGPLHDSCVSSATRYDAAIILQEVEASHLRAVSANSMMEGLQKKQVVDSLLQPS